MALDKLVAGKNKILVITELKNKQLFLKTTKSV